jgi:hypothetical protein
MDSSLEREAAGIPLPTLQSENDSSPQSLQQQRSEIARLTEIKSKQSCGVLGRGNARLQTRLPGDMCPWHADEEPMLDRTKERGSQGAETGIPGLVIPSRVCENSRFGQLPLSLVQSSDRSVSVYYAFELALQRLLALN